MSGDVMDHATDGLLGSATLVLVGIGALVFAARFSQQDAAVARRALETLAAGKPSAQRMIAWDRFRALGVDVGAAVSGLPDERERAQYKRQFIEQFSRAFRQTGGHPRQFIRWRIRERLPGQTVVAADDPARRQTLLLTQSGGWRKQLEAIQWQ